MPYSVSINRQTNKGIRLEGSNLSKAEVKVALLNTDALLYDTNTRLWLCYFMLFTNTKHTYNTLSEACLVSRQTIINNFPQVEELFNEDKLTIHKERGSGIYLEGNEYEIRAALIKNIRRINEPNLIKLISEKANLAELTSVVTHLANRIERHLGISFSYKEQLILQISFILLRIQLGFEIVEEPDSKEIAEKFTELDKMYCLIEDLNLNVGDRLYLYDFILKSEMRTSNKHLLEIDNSVEKEMASYLFEQLEKIYPISKELRDNLFCGLVTHLQTVRYRIDNQIEIKNEALEQIKISIPLIYQFTQKELQSLETIYGIAFEENEIAYIAIYIANAFESSYIQDNVINILLVCAFGVATSSLLKSRLEQAVTNCKIIGPVNMELAEQLLKNNNIDLIVTTNDDIFSGIPVVVVHPLLYAENIEHVKNEMFQLTYSKMYSSFIKAYERKEKDLYNDIKLRDYVKKEDIQIVNKCDKWQDAIKLTAQPLLKNGKIEKRYIDKMIEAVERFGTYMVLVPDTAFIHAGTEDGINENCASVLILNHPILLGDKNPKLVRNFVVLGIKNKMDNSLLKLVYIFEKEENLEKLKRLDISIQEVYELKS